MSELTQSPTFGIALTVVAYWTGITIQKKTRLALCNNMVIAVGMIVAVLSIFHIPFDDFYQGGSVINMLLGPATCCMAVSVYNKRDVLKKNWMPVLAGCIAGAVASVASVLVMCRLFGLDREMTVSLLPKSVTTPIAVAITADHGGIVAITAAAVMFTGILGNLVAPLLVKLFRVKDPVAVGLGIGACSHGVGTAKAIEMGETEGAMSGLAIGLCGVVTAILALTFDFLV